MIILWPKHTRMLIVFVSLLLGLSWAKASFAQTVASREQAGSVVAIERVTAAQDGTIIGEIRNRSQNTVRDVQLFIRYTWLWTDEFHPGTDDPSAAFYPTMAGEIAPGGSMPFKFTPSPPLSKRSGGQFGAPSVSIAGFTQVIQQTR